MSAIRSPRTGSPASSPPARGVPADPVAAAKWHYLAQCAGKEDEFLDDFVAGLPDEQRQAAVAAAQRWPAN